MRTTINLKEDLVKKAQEMTGIPEKTALIHKGLELLIEEAARKRLIQLGGSDKKAKSPLRRRTSRK